MPTENRRRINEVMALSGLVYGVEQGNKEQARPLEVNENGHLVVEIDSGPAGTQSNPQAPTNETVNSWNTLVLAENPNRTAMCFTNDSDEVIYLSLVHAAVVNQGIRMNSNGGQVYIEKGEKSFTTKDIYAIAGSNGNNLCVQEWRSW